MNIKGQGHSLTIVQCQSDPTFSNFVSLEIARPIEAKFHLEPPWDGGMKVSTDGLCHMTKMAAMSIYGKHPLNIFSGTKRPRPLKLGMRHWLTECYQICLNDDTVLTLIYFYSKVKFCPFCFCMGK